MTLLISCAFALDEPTKNLRTSNDVYDLTTLYHQDTLSRLDTLEDTVMTLEDAIHNSTKAIIDIENQEQQYIENRTQPLNLNMINIVFQGLMFCVIGVLIARHERRLIQKYSMITPTSIKRVKK